MPLLVDGLEEKSTVRRLAGVLKKYMRFIGPGLMVSVAYMDPGNYSTAVAAGSAYQYKLLFSIFLLNCLAIFLQVLSAKLGAVTGLDLAANCRENLGPNLNMFIYILAEIAIVATDLAEVVGTAIALNILFNIPLFLGVLITVIDVLIVLMAYRPNGPLLFIRIFELFVSVLVAGTVVCFAIQLFQVSKEPNFSAIEVLKGFLPNAKVIDTEERKGGNGLFLSLAILGATVMPHSLYLGSGLVQARLKDYDIKHGYYVPEKEKTSSETATSAALPEDLSAEEYARAVGAVSPSPEGNSQETEEVGYRPSIHAIDDTMTYTIVELVISLFTVALFVNATILIVAGATMGGKNKRDDDDDSDDDSDDEDHSGGDLFTIYELLSSHISPTAGIVFALALLCSGQSAGVVCTLAGQMVLEGFLRWSFSPVVRRLVTRAIAITPCLLVVLFSGREGLARTLNASQVVLSILLPVVTAPLIWFTCSKSIMRVPVMVREGEDDIETIYDTENHDTLPKHTGVQSRDLPQRFSATEPAIRLQDLRKAHPCAGWEDTPEDESQEQQSLILQHMSRSRSHSVSAPLMGAVRPDVTRALSATETPGENVFVMKGYTDMSNGLVMTVLAVLVWGFVTCLNLFLLGSLLLGYDVPL